MDFDGYFLVRPEGESTDLGALFGLILAGVDFLSGSGHRGTRPANLNRQLSTKHRRLEAKFGHPPRLDRGLDADWPPDLMVVTTQL